MVTVKYFASLSETLGQQQQQINLSQHITVLELWQQLHSLPNDNILVAINLEQADWDSTVYPNDEVAFFPPVTGG